MKHFKKLGAAVLALSLFGGSLVFTSAAYAADEAIAAAPAEATLEVAPSAEPTPKPTSSEESKGSEDVAKDSSESDSTNSNTEDTSSNVEEPAPAPIVEPEPEQLPDVTVQEPSTPTPDAELTEDTDVAKTPVADPPLPEVAPAPEVVPAPQAPPAVEAPSAPVQPKAAPSGETFVILTSGPNQTVRSDGKVTIAFNYDLRPNTEREGISPLLDVYVDSAAGERTWFGDQLTSVNGPATFNHSATLKPGTYTRYIMSTYLEYCDCLPIKDIVAPYTFIVPEQVTPSWPVQEGNIIKVVPQEGVIFTDKDGNVLTGDVPVPEGGLTVIRTPDKGYVFPEGTDTEKTYEYVPPTPMPIEVSPVFPKQEPGSNVITFTPQPGVIFTDADGNVIEGSFTVTPGKETVYAVPDLDSGYVFDKGAQPEKTYEYYKPVPAQPINVPAPIQDGNTVIVKPAPEGSEYYNVDTGETVPGDVDLLESGPITIGARPTGDRPVKTDGPWSYAPQPIVVIPSWPVQEGNIIKVVPQPCVLFVDKERNFLIGDVPIPEGGLTVIRYPDMGCVFPEGTEPSKTYEYVPPAPTGNGGDNSSSGNGHWNNGSGGNTNNSSHKDELAVTGTEPVGALALGGAFLIIAGLATTIRRTRRQQ